MCSPANDDYNVAISTGGIEEHTEQVKTAICFSLMTKNHKCVMVPLVKAVRKKDLKASSVEFFGLFSG